MNLILLGAAIPDEFFPHRSCDAFLLAGVHPILPLDVSPAQVGLVEGVEINNVLLADGCMLEGKVEDSVLFRQVTVSAGAEVSHCVVMNDCVIGEGAKVAYAILDKDVTVTPGAVICGTKNHPIVIKKGETV